MKTGASALVMIAFLAIVWTAGLMTSPPRSETPPDTVNVMVCRDMNGKETLGQDWKECRLERRPFR